MRAAAPVLFIRFGYWNRRECLTLMEKNINHNHTNVVYCERNEKRRRRRRRRRGDLMFVLRRRNALRAGIYGHKKDGHTSRRLGSGALCGRVTVVVGQRYGESIVVTSRTATLSPR